MKNSNRIGKKIVSTHENKEVQEKYNDKMKERENRNEKDTMNKRESRQ